LLLFGLLCGGVLLFFGLFDFLDRFEPHRRLQLLFSVSTTKLMFINTVGFTTQSLKSIIILFAIPNLSFPFALFLPIVGSYALPILGISESEMGGFFDRR